jgi:flagellar basal body P-ring protein FlgI
MNLFRSIKFDIDVKSTNTLLLSVYNYTIANKVNDHLKRYGGHKFQKGEEASFSITAREFDEIHESLGLSTSFVSRIKNMFKNGFQI